ncbi:nectin-3 isoform X3 [Phyllobates terribilis]|uniref:nectin-3 isoform X3 n=1 Tax=Phyllobates terribilis TaxID=111132 RepID=UPI003CCAAE18
MSPGGGGSAVCTLCCVTDNRTNLRCGYHLCCTAIVKASLLFHSVGRHAWGGLALQGSFAGPIHVDPHETAVWGKNITLKCLIEVNETITQISWEKVIGKSVQTIAVQHPLYGISFQESYHNRTTFKNTSLHDATIVINHVDFPDAGEYICKAVTFPLGNVQSSTTVTVLVEPTVSITKGPHQLMDGANETVAATCRAATGKPAAEIYWEESLGRAEAAFTTFANKTVTVISQYKLVPTRFARRRNITCIVKHPALESDIKLPFTLDIQYAPEVSITGYDGNWFVGRRNVQLKCNADANPPPTEIKWTRSDGIWPGGLLSVNNSLLFNYPLTHNVSGTYMCRVANALGQKSDQKIITILEYPLKDTSSLAAAGAIIGAVLALFFMTIFLVILRTSGNKRSYVDTITELSPTLKTCCAFDDPLLSVVGRKYHYKVQSHSRDGWEGTEQSIAKYPPHCEAHYMNEPCEDRRSRRDCFTHRYCV